MVDIQDLQAKLSKMLNRLENPNNIKISDYISDYEFIVLSYAQYLDNIYNTKTNKNMIPVYISEPSGSVEPVPTLGEINMEYNIMLYFPISLKDTFFKLMNYFIDAFAGRFIDFENNSGVALCNISIPTFSEIGEQEFKQFEDYLANHYKLPTTRTEMWGAYSFTLYLHQLNDLGKQGGFILGNQISYILGMTLEDKTIYTEDVVLTSSARNYVSDPISQQLMGELETKALNKNSSYGDSMQVYIRDNEFGRKFIDLFERGELQNVIFTIMKRYTFHDEKGNAGTKEYPRNMVLTSCSEPIEFGSALTFTLTFAKKFFLED